MIAKAAAYPPRRSVGVSDQARQHNDVRRRVLAANPTLATLAGPDWRTAIAAVLLLAFYWGVAWGVSKTNWWIVFLAAFFIGQFVHHAAATLVHESAHRLVFRNARAKLAFDLVIEALLTSFSRQLSYQHEHVTSHHAHLGDYEGDWEHEDIFRVAARRLYRQQYPLRSRLLNVGVFVLHLLPYGYFIEALTVPRYLARKTGLPLRDKVRNTGATKPSRGEVRLFFLFSFAVYVGLYLCFGFLGWLFHTWAMSIVLGRWGISIRGQFISEHSGDEPTRSTYAWTNRLFFNTGYHSEHHSFPNVAWSRLPKLKAAAPDAFGVANPHSYFRLWWAQMKAEFDLPKRPSARDPEAVLRRRMPEEVGEARSQPAVAA
jgi:sphingolipid delta-4 desaturase